MSRAILVFQPNMPQCGKLAGDIAAALPAPGFAVNTWNNHEHALRVMGRYPYGLVIVCVSMQQPELSQAMWLARQLYIMGSTIPCIVITRDLESLAGQLPTWEVPEFIRVDGNKLHVVEPGHWPFYGLSAENIPTQLAATVQSLLQ